MPSHELLSLDLRSPLVYRGIENPPIAGAPASGAVALPLPGGGLAEAALGQDLAEGEEELFAFEEEGLVGFDPDEGPRLAGPLPSPAFYGRSRGGAACGSCRGCGPARRVDGPTAPPGPPAECGDALRELPAGRYLFMQFRPAEPAELAAGIEWFAREAWWEGDRGAGPYFVRRVKEDGKLATQILRRSAV